MLFASQIDGRVQLKVQPHFDCGDCGSCGMKTGGGTSKPTTYKLAISAVTPDCSHGCLYCCEFCCEWGVALQYGNMPRC